jgi:hypothetical protein
VPVTLCPSYSGKGTGALGGNRRPAEAFGGLMTTAAVPERVPPENPQWTADKYLSDLNKIAIYTVTRGMLPLLATHTRFLVRFTNALIKEQKKEKEQDGAGKATDALTGGWPKWSQRLIARWLRSGRMPNGPLLTVVLFPYLLRLVVLVPWLIAWSVVKGSWDVLRKGIRGVPPLITALVVVFVTSDAWRVLGTGFTARFTVLVVVFLLFSLLFLVRWNCWDDIDAKRREAEKLLVGIRRTNMERFRRFMTCGAPPAPIVRPSIPGTIWVYVTYWLLCAFALVVSALFVSGTLILIGVILISKDETKTLAGSVHVYQTLPGGAVITMQLLSLSFSLGAFAAFFLVAAQKPRDRRVFMANMLRRYRRDLVVYSIYCHAHDRASDWTRVSVDVRPLVRPSRRPARLAMTSARARRRARLSNQLADAGRQEDALAAIQDAADIYRELAAAHPDPFCSDLAASLTSLSNRLADLGRREEALAAIEEAVTIRRELAARWPRAYRHELEES